MVQDKTLSVCHAILCRRGVPLPPSKGLKNCLLIGDSVTDGMHSTVVSYV